MYEEIDERITRIMKREKEDGSFKRVAFPNDDATRRVNNPHDGGTVWRTPFIRDVDKIMNCPCYNRYADKTQVFSLYKNDDLTRRGLHVQLVSRIARTIGGALNLNLDLIEAISLGHDIGHTPFGHAGERYLDALYCANAGLHFAHNIQSVRVLDGIYPLNISLQTLSGIAAHNGELELKEYRPLPLASFEEFDRQIKKCEIDDGEIKRLVPCTLEGCVVRISDIIAYLGKDRQDAERAKVAKEDNFTNGKIGGFNAEIVNNLMVNVIENSYGKDYIKLDDSHFSALKQAKDENNRLVYRSETATKELDEIIKPMTEQIYGQLLDDLKAGKRCSPIFKHHIDFINSSHVRKEKDYGKEEPNRVVVDYIASMTDDYFIDLHRYLFPHSGLKITYKDYFDDLKNQ